MPWKTYLARPRQTAVANVADGAPAWANGNIVTVCNDAVAALRRWLRRAS